MFFKKIFSSNVGDPYHRYDYMKILKPLEQMDFIEDLKILYEDFNIVCRNIGISERHYHTITNTNHSLYIDTMMKHVKLLQKNTQRTLSILIMNSKVNYLLI